MEYNKLVRDQIIEIIRADGSEAKFHIADDQEYWQKLTEKIGEELAEFIVDESPEELADMMEVIDAVLEYKGYTWEQIREIQAQKAEKRGGFKERIILEETITTPQKA